MIKSKFELMAGLQCHAIENKNRNHSINSEVKKLGYERRLIYKQPLHDLDLSGDSFARFSEKCLPKFIELCMETSCWCPSEEHQQWQPKKHLSLSFAIEMKSLYYRVPTY